MSPPENNRELHWQPMLVDAASRARIKSQNSAIVWFTGLSGAGKSTVANQVEILLHAQGLHTYLLDGDNIRHGLNEDLGFTIQDRVENVRRVAHVARLMADAGLIVLVALISPFRSDRELARALASASSFVEVFVDAPLEECIRRDPKGLYKKACFGEVKNFTGISSPYETPQNPEIHLHSSLKEPVEMALKVCQYLERVGIVSK